MTGKVNSSESSIEAKSTGCTSWRGTFEVTESTSTGLSTVVADVYFRNTRLDLPPNTTQLDCQVGVQEVPCEQYRPSGTVTMNYHSIGASCSTVIGPVSSNIVSLDGLLTVYTDSEPYLYEGTGFRDHLTGPIVVNCPGDPIFNGQWDDGALWFRTEPGIFHVKNDGTLIDNSRVSGDTTYEWHLEPAP